jgi:AcrR family transcriptional regulator
VPRPASNDAASLPAPPWQRTPERDPARRRDPITTGAIVAAALEVLDAGGLDGLTMRAVAERLDTGPASLYWHVGSKDGLLDLVLDRVIGEQRPPEPEPERWQEQLKEVAREMRATILRHRDVVRISIGRVPMGPNAVAWSERVLAIVRAGGVPDRLAVLGHHLLISVVNGFTMDETGDGGEPPAEQPAAWTDEMGKEVRDYIASLPADRFPNMVAVADYYAITDPEERFELLLEIFVEGLARRASALAATD